MDTVLDITAANGIRFRARIIRKGDRYGLKDCLTVETDRPLVEFYDTRFLHTRNGQFVSRYFVGTILEKASSERPVGLDLDGGIPDWKIDGQSMWLVRQWLHHETGLTGL